MKRYADDTNVPVEKSRAEIEALLSRYGADQFASGWTETQAVIMFRCKGRHVRLVLPVPDKEDFRRTPVRAVWRSDDEMRKAWEQGCRQRWRALALCIKAKLEAVECEITTFEQEFLAHIVLPSGESVGAWLAPQLDAAYTNGAMPLGLPLLGARS